MKSTLYIDIETIPGPETGKDAIEVKAPSNYKDPDKIKAYQEANKDEVYRKQSFDGGYGSICSFSFAFEDCEVVGNFAETRADESEMLKTSIASISETLSIFGNPNPFLCGHYISGFDLKFIMHRCIVLGITIPSWLRPHAKPWDAGIRDTMTMWAGARDTIGLDELCKILGIEGKGDMEGSQVYDYWLAGRHDEISAYCNDDVTKVRKINKIFMAAGL